MNRENISKYIDKNGIRYIPAKYTKRDRCSTIPVKELDYPEILAFKVDNVAGNRYYIIPKDELRSLYKAGKISSFWHRKANGELEELISEPGHPRIPKSGYGAHFKCIQINRSFE